MLGKNLPKPEAGKSYVFWTIAAGGGAPVNRGVLRPVAARAARRSSSRTRPRAETLDAVAVSLESDPKTPVPTAVKALAKGGS